MPGMNPSAEPAKPPRLPSRVRALWFWLRIRALTALRIARDGASPSVRRWPSVPARESRLAAAPVIAEYRSTLWDDGRADEFALIAGKVQNLRLARLAFDGVELPAQGMLSFWQQLGRATARKGYALGREIREGCVVPTVGGGICQLSNALATVAHGAGFALLERHGHTARLEEARQPAGQLDATVLWKHIDLRLRVARPCRLEVSLDEGELIVRLRGHAGTAPSAAAASRAIPVRRQPSEAGAARGCLTCNETSCFRHRSGFAGLASQHGSSVALLERLTPELASYLQGRPARLVLPQALTHGQAAQIARHLAPASCVPPPADRLGHAWALRRALWLRWHSQSPGRRQASILHVQRWQATLAAQSLRATDTQALVDQAYLPHLWSNGLLAARNLAVWMPALPMQAILRQLDAAARRWSDEPSLSDYRPEARLAEDELQALRSARLIVTPHHAVAQWARQHLRAEVHELPWQLPALPGPCAATPASGNPRQLSLALACSALARKGWRELCEALHGIAAMAQARGVELRLIVLGSLPSAARLPTSVSTTTMGYGSPWIASARAAVLPAHVEHSPRAALQALAAGLPVVATSACGIAPRPGLLLVQAGDSQALATALAAALGLD